MKAKHNVIFILVSSKWLIPYSADSSKFLISFVHFFLSGAPSYFNYIISKLHLIIARLLPEFFSTFPFVWSFFYYRSSSWRLYMVRHQGFFSFFNCSSRILSELRSAKLYSKINMVLNTCLFWEVQAFFILHSEVQFSLPYLLGWCYVIFANFLHVSWFTSCQEWDN